MLDSVKSTAQLYQDKKEQQMLEAAYAAAKYASEEEFAQKLKKNEALISSFKNSIANIEEHITGSYLFMLTDISGVLLATSYNQSLEDTVRRLPIRVGMYFTEDSCGVNAISESISKNTEVYLPPEDHESPFFKNWHCFCTPLKLNTQTIGYVDISTINADMKSELIAIAKLIPSHMLNLYQLQTTPPVTVNQQISLTDRQLHVLQLISRGETIKSIALKLNIKESTVNHHKKIIFEKLGVQSSAEAVSVAAKYLYL